jgi:hypothetical protein
MAATVIRHGADGKPDLTGSKPGLAGPSKGLAGPRPGLAAVAWAVAAVSIAGFAAAWILAVINRDLFHITADFGPDRFLVAYTVVGAVLASRRPANPVGWLLLGIGLVWRAAR